MVRKSILFCVAALGAAALIPSGASSKTVTGSHAVASAQQKFKIPIPVPPPRGLPVVEKFKKAYSPDPVG